MFCFFRTSRVRGNAGNTANTANIANNGNIANIWDGWDKWDKHDIWNKRPGREICVVGFGISDWHLRIVNC
ncbi:MAG: hypothetical protein KF831_00435 [Acidobacteria bacterium]|nr:hypothetical protein [Acidobacteriota bacterium]